MRFWGKHGVTEAERTIAQPLDIDIELECSIERAAASDDLADTVNYDEVFKACERIATQQSFHLLEALAESCLRAILEDRRIARATIRVRKPRLLNGATPEVEITKTATA